MRVIRAAHHFQGFTPLLKRIDEKRIGADRRGFHSRRAEIAAPAEIGIARFTRGGHGAAILAMFRKAAVQHLHKRNIQPIKPDHRRVGFIAMIVPEHGRGELGIDAIVDKGAGQGCLLRAVRQIFDASDNALIATVRQTSAGVYRKPVALGVGAKWAGETIARAATSTDELDLLEFPAGELYATPAATQTLLDDAYADIDDWLAGEIETAFSVQESTAFVSGDGTGKPKGFLSYPIVAEASHVWGKIGAVEGDFTQDDAGDQLIDLIHAPKSQFRSHGRFVMNRRTTAIVRKLKDAEGRYLWAPGMGGEAATVLGYPVTELEDMPDIADGVAAIAFGDFRRGYLIADRQGARVLRDPYSSKPYVLFYTTKRVGGGVQNFDAFKLMTFSVTAPTT